MRNLAIEEILSQLQSGTLDLFSALTLAAAPTAGATENGDDLVVARLDHDRRKRCGFAEFVYGAGKTVEQLLRIVPELHASGANVLVTRIGDEAGTALAKACPEGRFDAVAHGFSWRGAERARRPGKVLVVAAGTSDLTVAREAMLTLEACDCTAELLIDVGVAGLHRLLGQYGKLHEATVIIAVAGMEGALPSVLAGLVACPVIAVPTSVGYGAGLNGFTPLLAMLSSCASGVTVVNIDNGFGAGCAAARILPPARV